VHVGSRATEGLDLPNGQRRPRATRTAPGHNPHKYVLDQGKADRAAIPWELALDVMQQTKQQFLARSKQQASERGNAAPAGTAVDEQRASERSDAAPVSAPNAADDSSRGAEVGGAAPNHRERSDADANGRAKEQKGAKAGSSPRKPAHSSRTRNQAGKRPKGKGARRVWQ
jgi:hypothetical protein